MTVKWLIEDFDPDHNLDEITEQCEKQGTECKVVKYKPFGQGIDGDVYDVGENVLFIGTLNLGYYIWKDSNNVPQLENSEKKWVGDDIPVVELEKRWKPGCWLNLDAYKCLSYFPVLDEFLFNNDYVETTWEEFINNIGKFYDTYDNDHIFLRPDTTMKSFSAGMFSKTKLEEGSSTRSYMNANVDGDEVVIVSSPKRVINEWRFFVAGNRVVTGSLYKNEGQHEKRLITEGAAWKKAQEIADIGYNPDPMYSIDIAEDENGNLKLMEIGSFCCAGWYDADKEILVREATSLGGI